MNMVDGSDGQDDAAVRLISYCPKHCTPHPDLAGRPHLSPAVPLTSDVLCLPYALCAMLPSTLDRKFCRNNCCFCYVDTSRVWVLKSPVHLVGAYIM